MLAFQKLVLSHLDPTKSSTGIPLHFLIAVNLLLKEYKYQKTQPWSGVLSLPSAMCLMVPMHIYWPSDMILLSRPSL